MALLNDVYCQICDRVITKEQMKKHLISSGHLHREVNGFRPAYYPQRQLTRNEGSVLENAFWEMIFGSEYVLPMYEFLKTYFKICTNINNSVSVRPWFDDEDEEEQ